MALFTTLPNFMAFRSEGFLRYKLLKFGDFYTYYIGKMAWSKYIRCTPTWLPPYKPKEILQSLSSHNFEISKSINLISWGRHLQWHTLLTDRFF